MAGQSAFTAVWSASQPQLSLLALGCVSYDNQIRNSSRHSVNTYEFQPLPAEVSGVSDQACEWSEEVKQASDAKQSEAKPKECAERAVQENKCSERLSGLL